MFLLVALVSWAKLDDHFPDHPKVRALGVFGIALQTAAICYCARYLTDGLLSFSAADHLIRSVFSPFTLSDGVLVTPCVTSGMRGQDAVEWDWKVRMLEAGLWDVAPGGYRVHDYLVYNPTRASVLEERAKSAERVRRFRGNLPDGNAVSNGVGNGVTSPEVRLPRTRTRTRTRTTTPTPENQHTAGLVAGFARLWLLNPKKVSKTDAWTAYRKLAPDGELQATLETAITAQRGWSDRQGRFFPHLATWLHGRRWEDEPPKAALLTDKTAGNLDAARRFVERVARVGATHDT